MHVKFIEWKKMSLISIIAKLYSLQFSNSELGIEKDTGSSEGDKFDTTLDKETDTLGQNLQASVPKESDTNSDMKTGSYSLKSKKTHGKLSAMSLSEKTEVHHQVKSPLS